MTLLIARVWLKEPLGLLGVPSICLSGAGVALISSTIKRSGEASVLTNASSRSLLLGYAAAFASSLVNSLSYVTVRQARDSMHPLQWMLLYSALGMATTLPLCDFPTTRELAWSSVLPPLVAVVVAGFTAQTLIGYGQMVKGCRAGITALLSSSEMVWSYALQVIVLSQPATAATITGAILILVAICLPIIEMELLRPRNPAAHLPSEIQMGAMLSEAGAAADADSAEAVAELEATRLLR